MACSSDKEELQLEINITASSEERVDLRASGAKAYSWRQVSGTSVILINANSATASFIAPSISTEEILVFELEAVTEKNITLTKQVSVRVHPKTSLEDSTDTGSTSPDQEQAEEQEEENNTAENNDTLSGSVEEEQVAQGEEQEQIHDTNSTTTQELNNTNESSTPNNIQTDATLKSLTLTLEKTSLNVDETTTLKVIATYSDNTSKDVTDEVEWIYADNLAISIQDHTLKTNHKDTNLFLQAKYKNQTSNQVAIEIYKEINGHRLPPEPDPTINNATLLGVDINNNGVRDDVERKIYAVYKRPVEQAYMMQDAKIYPQTLEDPVAAAKSKELEKEHWNIYTCNGYINHELNIIIPRNNVDFMENAYFNTKERMRAYIEFNEASSGGVYSIPLPRDDNKENCDFNVTKMLEME